MSEESCNEHFNETKKLFPDFILVTHLKKDTCHYSSLNIEVLAFIFQLYSGRKLLQIKDFKE